MYIIQAILMVVVIGFVIFSLLGMFFFSKENFGLYIVKTCAAGFIGAILTPLALGLFNYGKDYLEKSIRLNTANKEFEYFEKTLSGAITEEEFVSHYGENDLSGYGKQKLTFEFDYQKKLKDSGLKTNEVYSLIDVLNKYPEIISALLFHPAVSVQYRLDIATELVDSINNMYYFTFLRILSKHENTPPEILIKIASRARLFYVEMVVENINAPKIAEIIYLIRKDANRQKSQLSGDYDDPDYKNAWDTLASDSHEYVRLKVAQHSYVPPEVLEILAEDQSNDVLCWVLLNENISGKTKKKIASKTGMTNEELLYQHVTSDESYKHRTKRQAIAKYYNLSKRLLSALSKDQVTAVRREVANRHDLSSDICLKLSKDRNDSVRASIAINPNTPNAVIESLVNDRHWEVLLNLAKNPSTPLNVLEKLRGVEPSGWIDGFHVKDIIAAVDANLISR